MVLLGIVALLFMGEITLRYICPKLVYSGDFLIRPPLFVPDSVVNYMFIPNLDYVHPETGANYRTNKHGYLGPEFPEKSDSRFRIAILGDSWVSGNTTDEYYTVFCNELQNILNQKRFKVDILNCGIEGQNEYCSFKSIKYKVLGFEPDLILYQYALPFGTHPFTRDNYKGYLIYYELGNDSIYNSITQVIDNYIKIKPAMKLIYKSYIGKAIFKLHLKYGISSKINYYIRLTTSGSIGRFDKLEELQKEIPLDSSITMVKKLRDELNDMGIRFSMYVISENEDAFSIAKENKLPFINMGLSLIKEDGDIFKYGSHPTKQGNEKIAQKFFEILTKYNFIPEKFQPNNLDICN